MNRLSLIALVLAAALSACDKPISDAPGETSPQSTAVADCCQCVTRGTTTTPSTPVACVTGTTTQSACDQACGSNQGGLMAGSCSDGIRCQ